MTTAKPKGWPLSYRSLWGLVGLLLAIADNLIKQSMKNILSQHDGQIVLTPFLNLTAVYNRGTSFGFLADAGELAQNFVIIIPFAICAAIYLFLLFYPRMTIYKAFIAMLLFGGGVGNLADRLIHGAVYDFIDLHLFGWHWPAFNLADIAISIAIIFLLIDAFKPIDKPPPKAPQNRRLD